MREIAWHFQKHVAFQNPWQFKTSGNSWQIMDENWKNQTGPVEWLGEERLIDSFFTVDLVKLRHGLQSGEMTPSLNRYLLRRPDAVCAVVVNTDKDVMYFVRQFRVGPASKGDPAWMVELAAGLVDDGENLEEAILREIREELGFQANTAEQISMFYPSSAIISERIYIYYVEVTEADRVTDGGGNPHEHEDIEILEIPLNQIRDFLEQAGLNDSKTMIGLEWYLRTRADQFGS